MTENEISKIIVDVSYKIHTKLGPGLLESVYEAILFHELVKRGLSVERQKPIPVVWENVFLDIGFRTDLIVENKVIIEIKSVEQVSRVHPKQLLTYLRITKLKLGLLINFGNVVKNSWCFFILDWLYYHRQIEEDIGSAEEQPTSNRFDTLTKNEGSLSALFYTFFGLSNG
jgi:GxxExxY protein